MIKQGLNKRHILILRWGVPAVGAAAVLGYFAVVASIREDPTAANEDGSIDGLTSVLEREVSEEMVQFRFEDNTKALGIDFIHFPDTRRSLLPEDMGSGVAWGDYDDDGDPDLFLVNFCSSIRNEDATLQQAGRCRLYRNDDGESFKDVTGSSGLGLRVFGLAAEWGDYDGDGDLDLYVTSYGPNVLMRNNGDGTFTDVTEAAGVGDPSFSAGCSWADYDRDGHLDLYVCNYVAFIDEPERVGDTTRQYGSEIPYTINPSAYPPVANRLYRNNGDGTFNDCAAAAGVENPTGRSLEAAWLDFDNDGWIDLYVANDVSSNGVFRNMGDGTFADIGASSLAADYRGAMGLAVGDHGNDGDMDVFVTHWLAQENAFFENMWSEGWTNDDGERRLFFMDSAEYVGLGHVSLRMVGWATGFVDFDNDGYDDLWVVNGNTLESPTDPTQLKPQQTHLFWHDPKKGFYEIGARACAALAQPMVGRGGAMADFDGDGRVDVAICRHGTGPLLLRNTTNNTNHWTRVELRQASGNTRALGARVELRAGGRTYTSQIGANASYLSQDEMTLHIGLGSATRIDQLLIHWPDGEKETHENLPVDRTLQFTRRGPS